MGKPFLPSFRTADELSSLQLAGLQRTVRHAYEGSPFYRKRLDDAGVAPGDIRSLGDLRRLPFVTAEDLQENYPFPLLSVPFDRIVRLHASSGTTGKRKVMVYTARDIDDWADMFARCYAFADLSPLDRVQICVGYGVWTAGVGFQLGCERFGAFAIPAGPGNLDMQMQFLVDFGSTVLCSTASMALLMAEEVHKRGLQDKVRLRKVIMGAERASDALVGKVRSLLGVEHVFDIPGLTEVYGPGTGLDCTRHSGIHYWADYYILEILDPETLEPVPEGAVGEMVYTTLRKEGAPLIRYRSRDLTRLIPGACPCGSLLPRHDRILGRSDDMFIVRGVNIYPSHIDEILSREEGIGSEYQIHLDRHGDGKDYMIVRVERMEGGEPGADGTLAARIERDIRKETLVSPQVEIVAYQSLPRTERKSRRVFDHRV
ncbi:MAG: Phenylacetate-coenzyme A ligase [Syntrophaceae bacterium PtaU1.Bin231]|nr:MAG: Phenylacetate-coenzyme A ligase [Syntrophaceae bacterium PtaU1.Bin231]HOG17321.1 phenylacetate--CoA ligase [Syntrophales bacterium]